MKASELNKAKYWLNAKLRDDYSPYGGTSYSEETLKEFLEEAVEINNRAIDEMDMHRVNKMLEYCGIKPIDYKFTDERKQFAVMIGMYFGSMSDDDRLCLIDDIVKFADNYDFDMVEEDGKWVIDTEKAREAAWNEAEIL